MNGRLVGLVTALAIGVFGSTAALADGLEDARMERLEERLLALEDKLEASERTIEAQEDLLRSQAAPAVSQGSGLDSFLQDLEVGGHITASYLYNFNSPRLAAGSPQPLCQFNCRHNEFKLDAAKIEIGKSAASPGEAGFQLDLLYGQNADISRSLSPTGSPFGVNGDDDFSTFVQQAYVSYNWDGVELKMGKFETLLGWELLDSHKNYNVTHGILFTWAIPLYHTGIMAGGSIGENVGWNLGFVNGFNNPVETNDNKGVLGLISLTEDPFFVSLSGYYGADTTQATGLEPGSTDDQLILDFVATYTPNDQLTFWLNADYGQQEDGFTNPLNPLDVDDAEWWGVAVGTNVTLSEKLSFAVRGEYFSDEDDFRGISDGLLPAVPFKDDFEAYSLTGTLKYALTDHLSVRGELRYDKADDDRLGSRGGEIFPDDSASSFEDDELFGIVEVSYVFD